jgi:hypothetical protein
MRGETITSLALTAKEAVSEKLDKDRYFIHPSCVADDTWRKLQRIFILESDANVSGVEIERITGAEAVRTLIDQTYALRYVLGSSRVRDHFSFCTLLASKVEIYRLRRSLGFVTQEQLMSVIGE